MPSLPTHVHPRIKENIEVLYEDNHLLVLSKPAGMPTVPDSSRDISLLDQGRDYLKRSRNKPGNVFLGVVHRLDRPVSGVVCFAVTSKAAGRLSDQMRRKLIRKTYLGITRHRPEAPRGILEDFLLKDRKRNKVAVVSGSSTQRRPLFARTHWECVAESCGLYLLRLMPETGRPHQLRVQCANMGCVLAGDLKYGDSKPLEDRSIGLHAFKLILRHPIRKEEMEFTAVPPDLWPWSCFKRRLDGPGPKDYLTGDHMEH